MSLVLRIKTSSGQPPIELSGLVRISTGVGNSVGLAGDLSKNKITLSDNRASYLDWYNTQVANKRLAINNGGSSPASENTEQPSFQYSFSRGKDAYIYGANSTPYIVSIQSSPADIYGNIQLLPGKTIDVGTANNGISLASLNTGIVNDPGTVYREINVFLWYLYHALNVQAYRLHIFSPTHTGTPAFTRSHLMGTIPAYQALVAKWNYLVWKRSFLYTASESGETLNFSAGYSGVSCASTTVAIKLKLILKDSKTSYDETIKFFTVYTQGVNTSLNDPPRAAITKYESYDAGTGEGYGESTIVDGHGTDEWAGSKTWQMIEILIPAMSLTQGEHYNASFSLAVALNEKTSYFYQSTGTDSFTFDLDITWSISSSSGASEYTEKNTGLHVRTILLHSEEDADTSSIEYDGNK